MQRKLLATDYDGTFRRDGRIGPRTASAVEQYRLAGGKFGFVTGRGMNFTESLKRDYPQGYVPRCDFFILYNGSLITDGDGNKLYEFPIPRELFMRIRERIEKEEGLTYRSETGDEDHYDHYYATFENYRYALKAASALNAEMGDEIAAFVNGPHVNVGLKGTGKAEGVSLLLRHFGLTEDECAVVGDDYNDLAMITAHAGWAVSTGRPEVKKAAPHLCASVGQLARLLMKEEEK